MDAEDSNILQFATKVVIALVKSPFYTNPESVNLLDYELKSYFSSIKVLNLGDFFFIQDTLNPKFKYQFKVIEVVPEHLTRFKIDNTRTNLSQANSIQDKCSWSGLNPLTDLVLGSYVHYIENIFKFYYTFEQPNDSLPILAFYGPSGCGKTRCAEKACSNLSLHLNKINCVNLAGESASAVEKRLDIFIQNSLKYGPSIILFKSFPYLFKLKDVNDCNKRIVSYFFQLIKRTKSRLEVEGKFKSTPFLVVCTANSKSSIDPSIASFFNHELEFKSLSDDERRSFFIHEFQNKQNTFKNYSHQIDELVKKSSSLFYGEVKTMCDLIKSEIDLETSENSSIIAKEKIENACNLFLSKRKFTQENRLNLESIKWSDVGGLEPIKEIIVDTILLPLAYPGIFSGRTSANSTRLSLTRSGILMYGAPGTGKTLLAKAIASECRLNFLSVKGPELLDMYVGQTEQNVRALFEKARLNSPCVLFFDELDSLAPVRGRAGDSGGVMDRVVSQLLTEIDGMDSHRKSLTNDSKTGQIFLIGATNRPDLIDPSLLRPGRFDKLIYVPIAKSDDERVNILKALVRKLPIDPTFKIEEFIKRCPSNLSGADFYSISNRARKICLKRLIQSQTTDPTNDVNRLIVCLNQEDFENALVDFRPTLTENELVKYEKYFNSLKNIK